MFIENRGLAIQKSESWLCFKDLVPSNHDQMQKAGINGV